MANIRDTLKKLFTRNVIIKQLPGGRLKTYDINKSQSIGSPTQYDNKVRWRSGRYGGYGAGFGNNNSNEEVESIRRMLYVDYELMDTDAIISSALDLVSEESTTVDIDGQLLKIKTDNEKIKKLLHNLFYDVLNIEFNMWSWIRTMCKYGDHFLYMQITPEFGVTNVMPIHPSLLRREEGMDKDNPDLVQFSYEGDGSGYWSREEKFESFEIAHFRLLTDTNFLPYGRSFVEPAKKSYKMLSLLEDAVLLHRIMRAPERRIVKIDIGNIAPAEVEAHVTSVINDMKRTPYIDPVSGEYNLRYNIENSFEDWYMPVRGNQSGNTVEVLPGLQNANAMEDVEYIRKKMMAALKIPKEFLGYGEDTGTGGSKCLHPDTKIPLLDGRVLTVKEITELFSTNINPNLWVYSFDFETDKVVPAEILIAEKTRLDAEIIRVHLDNDTYVDCTPDHGFLWKDGTRVEAKDLKEGDSLRAINRRFRSNRKNGTTYEQVYQPKTNKWENTHAVVDEFFNGKIVNNGFDETGRFDINNVIIRHHVDFNRYNNNPENLRRMTQRDHSVLHSEHIKRTLHSPESIKKSKETNRLPENRKKRSDQQKDRIKNNPELGLRLRDSWLSLTHEQRSDIVKSGRTEETSLLLSENAKRTKLHKKGQKKLKEIYPNGRIDLHKSNSVRWVERPSFEYILSYVENNPQLVNTGIKFQDFSKLLGYDSRIVRDALHDNGFTPNEFMNQYLGWAKGRHKDLKFDYINEVAENYTSIHAVCEKLGIGVRNLRKRIKDKYGDVKKWESSCLGNSYNHKVVKVEWLTERSDTYNLEVDNKNHNYLIDNEIVIKNSGLASLDIRFARTVERIQKIFVSELYKIAIVHLYTQGFRDDDLLSFELYLTNPSLVFERQKTDVLTAKVDLAKSIREGNIFSEKWVYENVFGMSEDEWKMDKDRRFEDAKVQFILKQITEEGNDPRVSGKSFGTPWDIASLQVSSRFVPGEDTKNLYTPDGREDNEGKPPQYKGNFETRRDQDFGRDPVGRRENDKMEMPAVAKESVGRFIKGLDKRFQKDTKKSLLEVQKKDVEMLDESKIFEDE